MVDTGDGSGSMDGQLRFTVIDSALGPVLVAVTSGGVCRVEFGKDPDALALGLRARFPGAEPVRDDDACAAAADAVRASIEGGGPARRLPLDEGGTPFQRAVWRELRRIPRGSVATYRDVAERIGRPQAARAVARACAANPIAVLTPCHRVVCADGSLGGYRWGADRKRALLAAEGALISRSQSAAPRGSGC